MSSKHRSDVGSRLRTRVGAIAIAGACTLFLFALPAGAQAGRHQVRVMTRNLYLGADLVPLATAPTPSDLFKAAADTYDQMKETNFTARARLLANEVKAKQPDLIAMQEVALWRREAAPVDGSSTPDANEVVYDFLRSLRSAIRARGLDYKVASREQEADLELPIDKNKDGTPDYDVRLTLRDVILAKRHLDTSNARHRNYTLELPFATAAGTVSVKRGWASTDVNKNGHRFRFVDTHLESFSSAVRGNQAFELDTTSGAFDTKLPIILAGDLNSDPSIPPGGPDALPDSGAYDTFIGDGFKDKGVTTNTCCQAADLLNATLFPPQPGPLSPVHIDHVLTKPGLTRLASARVGILSTKRTPAGLWPSDHAGVFSKLRLP